ncbi:MAG: hypothetical protein HQ521_19825 [Bacteroidetes bacterium]|nr:hypothetical protein [Bacteroidota bacterium]
MANVIIGIHGLDNKPPKKLLKRWWKLAMKEGLKNNNFRMALPKFELVYWADILYDKPLNNHEKDINSPLYLRDKYVAGSKDFKVENHNTRKKVIDFVGQQLNKILLNEDYSLNYSFISDAIMSNFFKDLEVYYNDKYTSGNNQLCKVKELIKSRLIKVLEKYKDDQIMLICHSMGSIVAFDVLNFNTTNIPIHTLVTMGSPLGIPVVMSKIAAEQKGRQIEGNFMQTPRPITKCWYNFSDILDRVAYNYKLADDFSVNKHNVSPIDFLVVNNYEIDGRRNPHKIFGYLRTPEFSKILNGFIQSEKLTIFMKSKRHLKKWFHYIKEKISL